MDTFLEKTFLENTLENIWPTVPGPWIIRPIQIGFINLTYKITSPGGDFILRIYQNIQAFDHIEQELLVMEWLQQEAMSFAVPVPVRTAADDAVARLRNQEGQVVLAMLLPVIPGHHPEPDNALHAHACGRALGELDAALQKWPQTVQTIHSPYGELAKIHPLVPDPLALADTLPASAEERRQLHRLIAETNEAVPDLYRTLPQQMIHGDFTRGNTLLQGERVTGVLDFEFAGCDLRALELAIGLNEGPANAMWGIGAEWTWMEAFGRGYAERQSLAVAEIKALPKLMRLRVAYFVIHFAGRYREGIDSEKTMRGYVEWALIHERWEAEYGSELVRRARAWF